MKNSYATDFSHTICGCALQSHAWLAAKSLMRKKQRRKEVNMLKQLGQYKNHLYAILANDDRICKLLLGEDYNNAGNDIHSALAKYMVPHPYVKPDIIEPVSYIFFETQVPKANAAIKNVNLIVQAICHTTILSYAEKPENVDGLRYDILSQYIEELLCPKSKDLVQNRIRQFGIGGFELQSTEPFFQDQFIGHTLTFTVPTFR